MKLSDLRPAKGANHRRKRLGTGTGSGRGGTCGRGTKGQGSRSGSGTSRHFEGGQLPIHRRLPKGGFTPRNRVEYQVVNLRDLAAFKAGAIVTPEELEERGLIRKAGDPVKLLATGAVEVSLEVHVDRASAAAVQKIEAAGGSVGGRI
ncbi:MAG: 50S ribosomal protein L15 [Candidatus Eiseniibacteriota bacterium]|jgi:large subunit ribosomal protein L15